MQNLIVLETLLAIYRKSGATTREIYDEVSRSPNAVSDAIKFLKKLGLIEDKREEEFPRRRRLYPTEKGRRIGELLAKIDEILGE